MPNKLEHIDVEMLKVLSVTAGSFFISLTNIEILLKIGVLSAGLLYTLWKWRRDFRKEKNKRK